MEASSELWSLGEQQIPPVSLRSRVGMTKCYEWTQDSIPRPAQSAVVTQKRKSLVEALERGFAQNPLYKRPLAQ
jgi:hypothetical protein